MVTSPMRRLFWLAAVLVALAITSAAQEPNTGGGPNRPVLKNGDKCTAAGGCDCGSPAINVPNKCGCQIDSMSGTGTPDCNVSDVPSPLVGGLFLLVGLAIGSGLTFVVMRRRTTSP